MPRIIGQSRAAVPLSPAPSWADFTINIVGYSFRNGQVALKKRTITATELAKKLGIDVANASRRLKAPIKLGYLVNREGRSGYPLKITLGAPLPDDQEILPSVKKVREHHAARMAKLKVKVKTVVPKTNGVVAQQSA